MDLSDPQQWKTAVSVVWNAPQVVLPLLIFVAGAAFWFGNRTGSAGKSGIREQANALKEQKEILNERLALAKDKEQAVTQELKRAKSNAAFLNSQISALASEVSTETGEMLATSTHSVVTSVEGAVSANNELREALSGVVKYIVSPRKPRNDPD